MTTSQDPPSWLSAPAAPKQTMPIGECYAQLASDRSGRVVYSDGALPAITPVAYAVAGRDIFFTPFDPQTREPMSGSVVALEADQLRGDERWVVVVTGIAVPCVRPSQWPRIAGLEVLTPGEPFTHAFVVTPGLVAGRRFTITV